MCGRSLSSRMMWETGTVDSDLRSDHIKENKAKLLPNVELNRGSCDMIRDSVILLEQVRTIDKQRLKEKICHIDGELLQKVNEALMISLELHTIGCEWYSPAFQAVLM